MLCERCHKNPANVYYSQEINGEKKELHVCSDCAKEMNLSLHAFSPESFINHFMGQGFLGTAGLMQTAAPSRAACDECGMTMEQFASGGRFGCAHCYDVFAPYLPETLKKLHGRAAHTGKVPARLAGKVHVKSVLEEKKMELSRAIANEEYERAAILRDEIKKLEQDGGDTK